MGATEGTKLTADYGDMEQVSAGSSNVLIQMSDDVQCRKRTE